MILSVTCRKLQFTHSNCQIRLAHRVFVGHGISCL